MFRYVYRAPKRWYPTTGVPPYELVVRAEEATATDGSSMVTQSVEIIGDGAILTVFSGVASGTANVPTVSGWTEIGTVGLARRITTFKRAGTFSGTATIDWGGQTQTFRAYCLSDARGFDMANLEIQEDSVIHETSTETSTSSEPLSLSTFQQSNNTVYLAVMHGGATPNLSTFEGGMTALQNRDIGAESISVGVAWDDAQDLQPDATWTNAGHFVSQAFEFPRSGGALTVGMNLIGPGTIVSSPKVVQSVALQLISPVTVVNNPKVTQLVAMERISLPTVVSNPTVLLAGQTVEMNKIGPTGQLFSPSVSQTVKVQLIGPTGLLFQPQVVQTVKTNLISLPTTLFSPSVTQTVKLQLIGPTNNLFSPQIIQAVKTQLIGPTNTLFNPKVIQTVRTQLIGPTGTLFNPSVTQGVTVVMNKIGPTGVLFNPTVIPGAVTVSMQLIGPTNLLFQPRIVPAQYVAMQTIGPTSVTFNPKVVQTVRLNRIGPATQIFSPSIEQLVQLQRISLPTVVYNPNVQQQLIVRPGTLGPNTVVFAPTIAGGYVIVYGSGSYTPFRFGDGVYDPEVAGSGSYSPTRVGSGRGSI